MRPEATEVQSLGNGVSLWHIYDSSAKADLWSSAVETDEGRLFIDPVSLHVGALGQLTRRQPVIGVAVTNENHIRQSKAFAEEFNVPIFAGADLADSIDFSRFTLITGGTILAGDIEVVAIEGAARGEVALYVPHAGKTLVVGDALINFEPYGFTFLPSKYCSDAKLMRRSLRQLLRFDFERILFAHGAPILSAAKRKLEQLLRPGIN
jgi:hypothetical protein